MLANRNKVKVISATTELTIEDSGSYLVPTDGSPVTFTLPAVGTAAGAGIGTDAVTVKVVDRVTAGGIVSATNYDELKFLTSTSETETTNT